MITQTEAPLLLDAVFGQRSKLAVLRCLYQAPAGISGREIGRRTDLSHQAALQALEELFIAGVVLKESIPPAYRFTLNYKHWIVKGVVAPAFEKELGWMDLLIEELARDMPKSVVSLILYGSAAKGGMKRESDIDLIALTTGAKNEIESFFSEKAASLYSAYQRRISLIVYEDDKFNKLYKEGNRFVREVVNTGRVVWGKLLTEVLFNGAKTH